MKYYEVFRRVLENVYGSGAYPLMTLSALSIIKRKLRLTPVGTQNLGVGTHAMEYNIQRVKRIKKVNHTTDLSDGPMTQYIKLLDASIQITWTTQTTKRTEPKTILVQVRKGEGENVQGNADEFAPEIAGMTDNTLIEKEEQGTVNISKDPNIQEVELTVGAVTTNGVLDKNKFADFLADYCNDIDELVDEYLYATSSVVLYNQRIGKVFAKLEGQGYSQGTNTFGVAFKKGFNYADRDFMPSTVFKSILVGADQKDDNNKVLIAIAYNPESYLNTGFQQGFIPIRESTAMVDMVGHQYDDLDLVIDNKRIIRIVAKVSTLKTLGIVSNNYKLQPRVNA